MKRGAWNKFVKARDHYRLMVEDLCRGLPRLRALQQRLVDGRASGKIAGSSGPAYTVETPVLYNYALDDVKPGDEISLILVADNPGRREQAAENRRYLVGPSGKIAEKFFRDNPALCPDFRKNLIILNKTPIHTPRTAELRELCRMDGKSLAAALDESQRAMARLLLEFHAALSDCRGGPGKTRAGGGSTGGPLRVWIIGYSEMRKGGIFEAYTKTLRGLYAPEGPDETVSGKTAALGAAAAARLRDDILLFRHFSMNQFTIDLKQQALPGETLERRLERIGAAYRSRILGW
ncbi:MAG: hypothetical protein LBS57_12890 [Treponema sp.]|jgi:hypothetical protein|nr:hypothetical protein [Treponema sp.]